MTETSRTLMGFEYQDFQTCGQATDTRIWNVNYNNGSDWRESGFKTQYETTTTTTSADVNVLKVVEAQPMSFTVGADTGTAPLIIDFRTTELNIRDAGQRDYQRCGTWSTGGNFVTDNEQMLGWPFESINPKLEALFERLTEKEKEKLEKWQLEKYDAKLKSEKLLKMMLSKKEYDSLKLNGELEIQDSRDQDVIFIVKKKSHAMVERHVKGKYKDRHCIVPNPVHELPIGDEILQKVLLLKNAPEMFEKIAIVHA